MNNQQKSLRIGAAVILFAIALRFFSSSFAADFSALQQNFSLTKLLLYAGTGRVYSLAEPDPPPPAETQPEPTQTPTEPVPEEPVQAVFSQEDAILVSLKNYPGYDIDVAAMLDAPLEWDLTNQSPTVLIFHSHTSESYENTEGYIPSDPYRTKDSRNNMVSIGAHLAKCLQEKGISVIHDTTVHDYPSYNDAYHLSRKTVQQYLEAYPSITLVLDIHRDAYQDASGNQASNTVTVDGKEASLLMLVAGTDAGGSSHSAWRENLSVAVKLHTVLQKQYPGLCRNITVRSSHFNQDLSPGALLVEVGTAGDTRQEALYAAELLADGIARLAHGSS